MALLFADGFEHYGAGSNPGATNMRQGEYIDVYSSTAGPTNAQARTGDRSFVGSAAVSGSWMFRKLVSSASNVIGVAFGAYLVTLDNNRKLIDIADGTTGIISLVSTPSGSIQVRRGHLSAATVLGVTDDGVLTSAAWNHIEVRVLRDNVVGEVEVRVNGVTEIILTDLNLGTVNANSVGFYSIGTGQTYIDDLIVWDGSGDVNNTFFGPARVTVVWLDDDEPGNQWSVTGAGSGAEALTETAPDGDTSYIAAAAVSAVSEFTISELPPEAEAIAGIYVPVMAKLASAGIGAMVTSIVSDTDVTDGPEHQLTTAYTYRGEVFEKDPATGQLWTKTDLEAARLRVEKTA